MEKLTIIGVYTDENGKETQIVVNQEFDGSKNQTINLDYISPVNGVPILRPTKPRK